MGRPLTIGLIALASCSSQAHAVGVDARSVFKKASGAVVRVETPKAVGSGFIISNGDLVVTCRHVVEDSIDNPGDIRVNGMPCSAVLAEDADLDIAVLKVLVRFKSSLKMRRLPVELGEPAYCVGYPLGLREQVISEGIVSTNRKLASKTLVQTSVPISEGSSGSPLLDGKGDVIGFIQSTLREGQQNNLALSVESARPIIDIAIQALLDETTLSAKGAHSRVVLGKLGQAIRDTKILSKPGGRSYYSVKQYEYLVLRKSDKRGYYKVLLQNGRDGYVFAKDVGRLPYDVMSPLKPRAKEVARIPPLKRTPASPKVAFADVVLTEDETTKVPREVFGTETRMVWVFFGLNVPPGTKIRGTWICEKSAVAPPNFKIDEATLTIGAGVNSGNFSLSKPTKGWPEGSYRVEMYVNDELQLVVTFTIKD